jgi:hypothetical protein
MEAHDAIRALEHVLGLLADELARDVDLIVCGHIHEYEAVAVLIGILQRAVVNRFEFHLHAGVEGLVDDLARKHVLDGGADECRPFAGLDVLEFGDGPQLAIQVQYRTVLNVVGCLCHVKSPIFNLWAGSKFAFTIMPQ